MKKRIAIIGSGISGLTAAYNLEKKYDVHIFEKNNYIGGHTHTHTIKENNFNLNIDSGFIVFNKRNYPNFLNFLNNNNVGYENSEMSFSVNYKDENFEWSGKSFKSLFTENRFLISKKFLDILHGILKFKIYTYFSFILDKNLSIKKFFKKYKFNNNFIKYYFYPICSSIWSNKTKNVKEYNSNFLIKFFNDHALNNIFFRPRWMFIKNGSNSYIKKIIKKCKIKISLNSKVSSIKNKFDKLQINANNKNYIFDFIICANHADEIIKIIPKKYKQSKTILSSIKFTKNLAVLHTDECFMPKKKINWSSWNYLKKKKNTMLTYWMNILQNLKSNKNYFVTINPDNSIDKKKIIKIIRYSHPIFKNDKEKFENKLNQIQGIDNIYFCGAWTGYGFHEDGVNSAKNVTRKILSE
jgi:predicted NAD/FAD-binding protein